MIVKLVLFASAKDIVGESELNIGLEDDATLGDVKSHLAVQFPALVGLLPKCAFSVDQEYSIDSKQLYHGCEVACIPPVSGG